MFRVVAPSIQDYLQDRLAARLPAVACSVGYPAAGPAAEQLWVEGAFSAQLPSVTSGMGGRDETGTLTIRVLVTQTAEAFVPVRDRALEIVGEVEDLLLEDPTINGLAILARVTAVQIAEAHPEEHAVQTGATVTITYTATVSAA